jgi:hypothetical protein
VVQFRPEQLLTTHKEKLLEIPANWAEYLSTDTIDNEVDQQNGSLAYFFLL